jgi:hypothetical protein
MILANLDTPDLPWERGRLARNRSSGDKGGRDARAPRMEMLPMLYPASQVGWATTLAGRGHLQLIPGGHSIPLADIKRRFPRSFGNLLVVYAEAVDYARCFLNSGKIPQLIFVQRGKRRTIYQPDLFRQLFGEET